MTAPAGTSLAACRAHFVARTLHLAALDAQLRTQHSPDSDSPHTVCTPEDLLPRAIGWMLREHGPRCFHRRLSARDAEALTRALRMVAGTPSTGCCGDRRADEGCYECGALSAGTRSEDPALLFDFALTVLGWAAPGGDESAPAQ
jgi:hypothetical protein